MSKKNLQVAFAIILVAVGAVAAYRLAKGETVPLIQSQPKFKYVNGYNDGNYLYSCSKPIKASLRSIPGPSPGGYQSYIPVNPDEAKLFCQSNGVIENEGKIKVLQQPGVLKLIDQYRYKDVSIKALEFK